jgi:hypothetical protein
MNSQRVFLQVLRRSCQNITAPQSRTDPAPGINDDEFSDAGFDQNLSGC